MAKPLAKQVLIAGGGIGGLAAALACARIGAKVSVFEKNREFTEVGAGLQLGPNVTHVLHGLGLQQMLQTVAAMPGRLQVNSAASGRELATLALGESMLKRYGAPYLTVHRADLQTLLLTALKQGTGTSLKLGSSIERFAENNDRVTVRDASQAEFQGDMLIGADGLWSQVRQQLLGDGAPYSTGHQAYRALVAQDSLPSRLRSRNITVWLGADLHVVEYPVRGGDCLNVVAILENSLDGGSTLDARSWDHNANAAVLQDAMGATCSRLQQLIHAIESWRLWPLSTRRPVHAAGAMARGRVALLGDAGHPMLPYLAQGAGMAIEDAHVLAAAIARSSPGNGIEVSQALRHYAELRWRRNARVQARALRNGQIFHASGVFRLARDASLKLLGPRLLDNPWLYRHRD